MHPLAHHILLPRRVFEDGYSFQFYILNIIDFLIHYYGTLWQCFFAYKLLAQHKVVCSRSNIVMLPGGRASNA